MSFSLKVKNEVCKHVEVNKQEAIAELSAIMKVSGTLLFTNKQFNFKITTENAAIARLVLKFKRTFWYPYRNNDKEKQFFKKNNIYIILISEEEGVKSLLKEVGIIKETINVFSLDYNIPKSIIECDECRRAYIRGAFLGGGSISNPEKTYHLEFVTHNEEYAKDLSNLINSYNLNSKVIKRKNSYIIYLKEGEQIVDLLNIIGAHASLLELENVRIMKEMRNNVNRLVNCETANLSKTVNAAVRQVESIKFIEREIGLGRLPKNLRDVAELRIKYPDESLRELGKMLNPPVGKSGVNHRLRRIEKIADELKQGI